MTLEEEQAIREKLDRGITPTLDEVEKLFTMYDMLQYENDFLRTDREIVMADNEALKEHCVLSNPAIDFEVESKWVKKPIN